MPFLFNGFYCKRWETEKATGLSFQETLVYTTVNVSVFAAALRHNNDLVLDGVID